MSPQSNDELVEDKETLDLLSTDEPEPEVEPEIKEEEVKEEVEEEEVKEEEEEIKLSTEKEEETEEEDLELVLPARTKDILKKYPDIFKDFPYLQTAYKRDKEFTELFSTVEDAKEVVEKVKILDRFEADLSSGKTETVLRAVKENDAKAYGKIVDDYLPTLERVDRDAYNHIMGNIISNIAYHMSNEGKNSENEDLQKAASVFYQFMTGSSKFQPSTKFSKDTNNSDGDSELARERAELFRERFETARNDLDTRVSNVLKSTINDHIDPKKSMTDYVRRTATRDAYENLQGLLDKDPDFRRVIDNLWKKAAETKFSKQSVDKIRATYLSRAKTMLPSVIRSARNEALKGLGKKVSDDRERKGPIVPGRSTSTTSGKVIKDVNKMSTLDILSSD